jgi:hypothetical protein
VCTIASSSEAAGSESGSDVNPPAPSAGGAQSTMHAFFPQGGGVNMHAWWPRPPCIGMQQLVGGLLGARGWLRRVRSCGRRASWRESANVKQKTLICKQRELQRRPEKTLISSWHGITETEKTIFTGQRGIKK